MTTPTSKAPLQAATVDDLLRIQGFPPVEDAVKAPVAVGGANAVAAVVASRQGSIFDTDPATFLSELDRLAGPNDP
jgi:hypothetical protein